MSEKRSDGGPAFSTANAAYIQQGMSLRDYFAGQALVGLLANPDTSSVEAPKYAYFFADTMLAVREKNK